MNTVTTDPYNEMSPNDIARKGIIDDLRKCIDNVYDNNEINILYIKKCAPKVIGRCLFRAKDVDNLRTPGNVESCPISYKCDKCSKKVYLYTYLCTSCGTECKKGCFAPACIYSRYKGKNLLEYKRKVSDDFFEHTSSCLLSDPVFLANYHSADTDNSPYVPNENNGTEMHKI